MEHVESSEILQPSLVSENTCKLDKLKEALKTRLLCLKLFMKSFTEKSSGSNEQKVF